jgi:hypothetical protein
LFFGMKSMARVLLSAGPVRPPLALLAITLSAALARADDLHLPVAASDTEGMQAYESLPGKLTLDAALKI